MKKIQKKKKKIEVKVTKKVIISTSKVRVKTSVRPKIEEEVKTQKRVEDDYKSVVFRDYMRKRRLEEEA